MVRSQHVDLVAASAGPLAISSGVWPGMCWIMRGKLKIGSRKESTGMAIENNIEVPRVHVNVKDVEWTASPQYPEERRRVYRYKALIGGDWPRVIPQQDIIMGILELAPGAIYSAHAHPAPELYYVMSGSARWTVNEDTFD